MLQDSDRDAELITQRDEADLGGMVQSDPVKLVSVAGAALIGVPTAYSPRRHLGVRRFG